MPPQIQLLNADIRSPSIGTRMPSNLLSERFARAQPIVQAYTEDLETGLAKEQLLYRQISAQQQARTERDLEAATQLQERKAHIESQMKVKTFAAETEVAVQQLQMNVMSDARVKGSEKDSAFDIEFNKLIQKETARADKAGLTPEARSNLMLEYVRLRGDATVAMKKASMKSVLDEAHSGFLVFEDTTKKRILAEADPARQASLFNDYANTGLDLVRQGALDGSTFTARRLAFGREIQQETIKRMVIANPSEALQAIEKSDLAPSEKISLSNMAIGQVQLANSIREANEKREEKLLQETYALREAGVWSQLTAPGRGPKDLQTLHSQIAEMAAKREIDPRRADELMRYAVAQIGTLQDRAEARASRAAAMADRTDTETWRRAMTTVLRNGGSTDNLAIVNLAGRGLSITEANKMVNENQQLLKEGHFTRDQYYQRELEVIRKSVSADPGLMEIIEPERRARLKALPEEAELELFNMMNKLAGLPGLMNDDIRKALPVLRERIIESFKPVLKDSSSSVSPMWSTSPRDLVEKYKRGQLSQEQYESDTARYKALGILPWQGKTKGKGE
jgi:hypothetical protein